MLHPTAIVHPGAEIGKNAEIGPYCIVGEHVSIGARTVLQAHVVVNGWTEIGEDCLFILFRRSGRPRRIVSMPASGPSRELATGPSCANTLAFSERPDTTK